MRVNPKIVQIRGNFYHYRRLFGENTYTNSLKMTQINQLLYIYNWLNENYSDEDYADIRCQRAIDIAFAFLRATDTDAKAMSDFLKKELTWSAFFKGNISLKRLVVYAQKILPLSLSKLLIKKLYPLFYK